MSSISFIARRMVGQSSSPVSAASGRVQSFHVVSSATTEAVNKTSQESQKQSQNNYVTAATQHRREFINNNSNLHTNNNSSNNFNTTLSARDIEIILANIGVATPRASRPTIESMIQNNQFRTTRNSCGGQQHGGEGVGAVEAERRMSASEMIDLIAQIRSM